MTEGVRPTKRVLDALDVGFPPLTSPLEDLAHPLVLHAQMVPEQVAAGGAERIRSLQDRVWFKVKTEAYRGAVGEVDSDDRDAPVPTDLTGCGTSWWLGAAGRRQSDSPQRDFYASLSDECVRRGKELGQSVSTRHLLPRPVDFKRWEAERVTLATTALQQVVREIVARAAQTGKWAVAEADRHELRARVHVADGETYLVISTEGYLDPKVIAVILAAVPGVPADDWQAEPGKVSGVEPGPAQIVFSTLLPESTLVQVLDDIDGTFL